MLRKNITLITWILASLSQLGGCQNGSKLEKQGTKIIQIGPYAFDFPLNFEKRDFQGGFDSYVGVIESEHETVHFDYGFYANPLTANRSRVSSRGLVEI
ncbi:hypothetical protein ACFOET_08635 [Parapedobacter deserti]|uniref:Amino acid ABC transporter substrate-binding protein n=1 Tax=Parapedobacter deserti TaxID=1912957 RepID=A0ABV7JNL0_9SPHI